MADPDAIEIEQCWPLARLGDQEASRRLVELLYPLVIRIVRSHLPRAMEEEDLAQEIFLKMFARMHQYRGESPVSHWVSRVAVTTCLDHLRRQQRHPEVRWADLTEEEISVVESLGAAELAEDEQNSRHAQELIQRLLQTLLPEDQMIIRWLDLEEQSVEEIRQKTGWSASLIKVRAFRARRKLRQQMEHWEREGT
jgi:RNA polymerase sigma-70 factor (ECF subfamily)